MTVPKGDIAPKRHVHVQGSSHWSYHSRSHFVFCFFIHRPLSKGCAVLLLLFQRRTLRTSAAAAAAALGSLAAFLSPNVLAGPPTVGFGVATLLGIVALAAGAGASPNVRPGPSKFASDCFPQQLPIGDYARVRRRGGGVGGS
jgi:hypothetical protein